MFDIKETDMLFTDSPDAGDPKCICSRCGNRIADSEMPIRAFVSENGDPENITGEYRFCEVRCWASVGITGANNS